MIGFADPWLLLLLPLPVMAAAWSLRRRNRSTLRFPSAEPAFAMPRTLRVRLRHIPLILRTLGAMAIVVALARPQAGIGEARVTADGVAIMTVVDRSFSMSDQMNFDGRESNRISVVKHLFREFILGNDAGLPGRPHDLIGLVAFAGYADTVAPLTFSHTPIPDLVDAIELASPSSAEGGTAIGDGLSLAAAKLKRAEEDLRQARDSGLPEDFTIKSKVIVLLTDGDENRGEIPMRAAAEICRQWGIRIYAVGIGASSDGDSSRGFFNLSPSQYRFMEGPLRAIAEHTGGKYWRATDADSLRRIYAEIDELEKTEIQSVQFTRYRELFPRWLTPALALLGAEALLAATWLRRSP